MDYQQNTTIDDIGRQLNALGDYWQKIGQWRQPTPEIALMFMVTEAGKALDAWLKINDISVRNYPSAGYWSTVDEKVADTVIMALRYFASRGISIELAIRDKIEQTNIKKEYLASHPATDAPGDASPK